jgi:hypothetical protein
VRSILALAAPLALAGCKSASPAGGGAGALRPRPRLGPPQAKDEVVRVEGQPFVRRWGHGPPRAARYGDVLVLQGEPIRGPLGKLLSGLPVVRGRGAGFRAGHGLASPPRAERG